MDTKLIVNIKPIGQNAIAIGKNSMQIKLYTIIGCKACLQVKNYFDTMNIEYEEINCDKDIEKAVSVMTLSQSNELPIVQYDRNNFIIGYNKSNLNKLYQLYKD